MDTLDRSENNQISERAIRNLSSSSVWIIISSACGMVTGLYFLYAAFLMMSSPFRSQAGGIILIFALIITSLHIVGLAYGVGLSKVKVYTPEELDRASAKQNAYWIFAGIAYIIWTLLLLLSLSSGGMGRMF